MLSEQALARVLERVGLVAPVRFEEVTGSTNALALAMAAEGAPEWTLVAAGHQTEGRGRLGRTWEDVPGSALMCSLVLRPELPAGQGGLIPLLAGWSMGRACAEVAGAQVGCRWPNDLVLASGGKVGGVLCEGSIQGDRLATVVVGVGVNLDRPPRGVEGAGAIAGDAESLLQAFLRHLRERYRPADPAFAASVLEAYRPVCRTLGRRVRAEVGADEVVEGEAVDVDPSGALVIRTAAGPRPVGSGEIVHLSG